MSKIFKPRRGTLTTMTATDKKNTVLAKGEMFIEVPNNGVGTGPSRLVIGNGTDTYATISSNHKYAIDGISGYNTSEVNADSSATETTSILNDVVDGKTVRNLFGNLKKAVAKNAADIATINDDLDSAGSGYGDMLKSTYDPNNDGIIAIAQGGTGSNTAAGARTALGLGSVATENTLPISKGGTGTTDGTINGVKLGKSGSQYGYYDGSTFKAFRNPTGGVATADQATEAQVLSGKHFANSSSDDITGTMADIGTLNKSVSVGTPSKIPAGYHDGNGVITAINPSFTWDAEYVFGATYNLLYFTRNGIKEYFNFAITSPFASKIAGIYIKNSINQWVEVTPTQSGYFYSIVTKGQETPDLTWTPYDYQNKPSINTTQELFIKIASSASSVPPQSIQPIKLVLSYTCPQRRNDAIAKTGNIYIRCCHSQAISGTTLNFSGKYVFDCEVPEWGNVSGSTGTVKLNGTVATTRNYYIQYPTDNLSFGLAAASSSTPYAVTGTSSSSAVMLRCSVS